MSILPWENAIYSDIVERRKPIIIKMSMKKWETATWCITRILSEISTLKENDEVLSVHFTNGNDDVVIASNNGRMIRFNENEIRVMGRTASGVKGIELSNDCFCVGSEIAKEGQDILVVTEKGYGKRTDVNEYRLTHRGSKGVKTLNITDKNGTIVAFKTVTDDKDLMIITDQGIVIRISADKVSRMSRVTQGVRLINLKENQKVTTIATTKDENEEENTEETVE